MDVVASAISSIDKIFSGSLSQRDTCDVINTCAKTNREEKGTSLIDTRKDAEDVPKAFFPRHLLIIDTETTGLLKDPNSRVIQLAAILLDKKTLEELDSWESFIWTSAAMWELASVQALKIHGITYTELREAPLWNTAWEEFLSYFSLDHYDLYGQNIFGFDVPMLKRMCDLHNCHYPFGRDTNRSTREIDLWPFFMLSGIFLDHEYGTRYAPLRKMARHYNISAGTKHNALEDCRITAEVLRRVGSTIGNR